MTQLEPLNRAAAAVINLDRCRKSSDYSFRSCWCQSLQCRRNPATAAIERKIVDGHLAGRSAVVNVVTPVPTATVYARRGVVEPAAIVTAKRSVAAPLPSSGQAGERSAGPANHMPTIRFPPRAIADRAGGRGAVRLLYAPPTCIAPPPPPDGWANLDHGAQPPLALTRWWCSASHAAIECPAQVGRRRCRCGRRRSARC
jgi:hypothetical protein